jgi:CheY-like chemotaxis protein
VLNSFTLGIGYYGRPISLERSANSKNVGKTTVALLPIFLRNLKLVDCDRRLNVMATQKVLIVDDSKAIRMQVREMLPKGSFEVLEAADGMEGLEVINREALSLILIDFFMPRLNGWEVVQKLRDHPRLKNIPVVMMSGRREDVEQAVPDLFSYFEFVGKPFEQPLLVQAIKAAMAKARSRQQVAAAIAQTAQPAAQPAQPAAQTTQPVAQPAAQPITQPVAAPASSSTDLQALQTEMRSLRQENTQLRTEVDSLKKQVAQIMAFIRQRMK